MEVFRAGRLRRVQTRRHFLSSTLAATAAAPLLHAEDGENPVVVENRKPGTLDWMLTETRTHAVEALRCPWIEGFCSCQSVSAGGKVEFFVSTDPAAEFHVQIFRLGWYGGKGGRHMKTLGPYQGKAQPVPEHGEKRVRICQWEPCAALDVPGDWLSGVYLAKLILTAGGPQSYIIFIVRDHRRAALLFQCSDHTWQAYNRWPAHSALYDDGKHEWYWGGGVQVSFQRPYGKYCQIFDAPLSTGSGEFLLWEFPFAFWLEQHGYDITYLSNQDTHRDPVGLLRAKGFLSIGHDEYWTLEMFRHVQAAVTEGVSVGFFSGNAVCGRVQWDAARRGFERIGVFGPPGGTQEFDRMKTLAHERPYANELIGAHSTGPVTGGADWVCALPDHWIFEGTGMKKGDGIPGLVGWEWHGDPAPIRGLEIVATAPTQSAPGQPNGGKFTATVYPGPKGNIVFNASTIWWGDALSAPPGYIRPSVYASPRGPDARAQRITHNILRRMTGRA